MKFLGDGFGYCTSTGTTRVNCAVSNEYLEDLKISCKRCIFRNKNSLKTSNPSANAEDNFKR